MLVVVGDSEILLWLRRWSGKAWRSPSRLVSVARVTDWDWELNNLNIDMRGMDL